jgi:hypothetical protein
MDDDFQSHLFTEGGALCGAAMPYAWAWRESQVTCSTCRGILRRGSRSRRFDDLRDLVRTTKDVEPE